MLVEVKRESKSYEIKVNGIVDHKRYDKSIRLNEDVIIFEKVVAVLEGKWLIDVIGAKEEVKLN